MDRAQRMLTVPAADDAALRSFYIDRLGWSTCGDAGQAHAARRIRHDRPVWTPVMRLGADGGLDLAPPPQS